MDHFKGVRPIVISGRPRPWLLIYAQAEEGYRAPGINTAAAPGDVTVEVHELTRRFGDLTAVDHISFSIFKGETFGLIGPNGAGKSTLMKMLTTMLPPTSGRVTIAGFDVGRQAQQVRARI